jgi:glycosyltransferase involved in cell wall biosynthesis
MPVISVIIPVYNVQAFLESCVNSVLVQTLEDIEVILVNDGSHDNSGEIAEKLATIEKRVKVIHKVNGGPSSARNTGIKAATGDYISFIDSDDWVEPNFLESLYSLALENNADIVNTGITVEFLKGKRIEKLKYSREICMTDKSQFGAFFWELHKLKLSNYPVTRLFRKGFLFENNILFDTNVHVGEDLLFNLEAFKCANVICVNTLAPYHYMKRELATLTSSYNVNFLKANENQFNAYKNFFEHFSMNNTEQSQFLEMFYIQRYTGAITNLYKRNSPHNFNSRLEIIKTEIFRNKALKQKIRVNKLSGLNNKLFVFLLLNGNPLIMFLTYKSLFFFRYNFEKVYLKHRHLLKA